MNLILSKYTHYFRSTDKSPLVYNSEKNCFIRISESVFEYIDCLSKKAPLPYLDQETLDILIKYKIIINHKESNSYYNKIRLLNCMDRFNSTLLTLNIIPTTCCNFSCSYCFEKNKSNHTITDQVIEDLIHFINKNENTKKISLMWYGGEPLIAFGKIKKIITRIFKEGKYPVSNHSMVTNGYLFDEKVCNFFKDYPLNDIQITIDGDENDHNSKRFTKSDKSTFNKIISNIDIILKELPTTRIYLRINIDEENKDSFHLLHKQLGSRWNNHPNLIIYPGFIRIEDDKEQKMITPSIIGDTKRDFFLELEDKGTKVKFYPRHVEKACSAVRMNTFIIGPEGEFYKCWNDVSNKEKIIGYINRPGLTNPDLLAKYIIDGPMFDDPECKNCFFFPICGGGCPEYRLKNKYENGNYDLCAVRNDKKNDKQYLTHCLEKHYERINSTKEILEI